MRGWALSNTMRANRHWQSGNRGVDIFTDSLAPVVIRAGMFGLDSILSAHDYTQYGEYGHSSASIITISQGVNEFRQLTGGLSFSRLWYRDASGVHIQADQNIAVDGLKIYLTGLTFELLYQPEEGNFAWVKPDVTTYPKKHDIAWGSIHPYGGGLGVPFSGNTYANAFVNITIAPKTTESFLMPTWGLSGPKNQSEMDQEKTIQRSGVLLTDGLDLTVEFKDPSRCNALILTEMGFCTNSYELKSWQFTDDTIDDINAWDANIPRSYKLKVKVIK